MKTKSKLLILCLTLLLLCGAFVLMTSAEATTTAVGADTLADAWQNASDGDTLAVGEDFTYAGTTLNLEAGKTLTLDLGGHTLTVGDTAFLTSAGNLTVKNGTLVIGNAVAIGTTGGELTLTDLTVKNTLTDTVAAPAESVPVALVSVSATKATLSNVTISGVAYRALKIASGSTVTAENTTLRNAKLPGDGTHGSLGSTSYCAALEVNGNNTVEIRKNSLVEATYVGFLFTAKSNDAAKNTFLFEDSVLNVTFKEGIDGNDLVSATYNGGNLYKVVALDTAHVSATFNRVKVIGYKGAKGIGVDGTLSKTTAHFTIRDSQLYMSYWGCNTYTTFEGTNFILNTADPAFGSRTVGLNAAAGSRTYFLKAFKLEDTSGGVSFVRNDEYNPENLKLTQLPTALAFRTRCGQNSATTESGYTMTHVLTRADETPDTKEFEDATYDGSRTAIVYNAAGEVAAVCYEGIVNYGTIPDGGTLRFYEDVTVSPLSSTITTFTRNVSIDMNGHWLSIGGSATASKNTAFRLNAAVDVYFYTSREGGGIRLLAIADKSTSSFPPSGSNPLFQIDGQDAHLHLGYAKAADGEDDYRDNGFTVVSSVMAQLYGGKVTVKGGNYYRVFGDNAGFFNVRYTTPENTEILSFEDAYFYSYGTYAIVSTQGGSTTQKGMTVSFTDCFIDNSQIFRHTDGSYKTTCEDVKITLTGSLLNLSATQSQDGVTIELGEGCRYSDSVPAAYLGAVTSDVNTDAYTVSRRNIVLLTPVQLAAGKTTYTGETTDFTFTKKVTDNYATVAFSDGSESKWELGATIVASGITYRKDGTLYIAKDGVILKNGETVYADAKIPEDLTPGTALSAEVEYETKAIAVVFRAEDGGETYIYPTTDEADALAMMEQIQTLTASTDVILYKNVTLDTTKSLKLTNLRGKTLNFDLNGYTFSVTNGCANNTILFVLDGATMHIYSSLPGGCVKGPGATRKLVSVNTSGTATLGAYNGIPGDNFSTEDIVVCDLWSQSFTIDGGTYSRTGGSNAKLFDLATANTVNIKNATILVNLTYAWGGAGIFEVTNADGVRNVNLENCNVYTNDTNVVLFTASGSKTLNATINGGNFYGLTLRGSVSGVSTLTYNLSNAPRFAAVEDGALSGKTPVHIADAYLTGKSDSPVSVILADSTDGSYLATFTYGGKSVTERWLAGEIPAYRETLFGTYYWLAQGTEGIAADTEYQGTVKTTASKVSGNLTLYANITFNLYFKKDGFITGVTYNGVTTTFTDADLDSTGEYYIFKISDIAPKDLADAFTLEVLLASGEETATYTVKTSLAKYASSVLASEESKEGKTLVLALLDYVREMSVALGDKTADDAGIKAIDAGLKHYNYTRTEWTGTATISTAGNITAASLHLASDPGFLFYLNHEKYGAASEVTLTVNGVEKTYTVTHAEGENDYILVDSIHVSKYTDDLTVALDGETFTYNLGVYLTGFDGTIPDYAHALYSYSLAAKAYLAATAGN